MRVLTLIFASLLLTVHVASSASVRLVEDSNGRVLFEVRFNGAAPMSLSTPGLPEIGFERVFVAIPPGASVRVSTSDAEGVDRTGGLTRVLPAEAGRPSADRPAGLFPPRPAAMVREVTYRGQRLAAIDCYSSQVDLDGGSERVWNAYTVTVTYTPAAATASDATVDPFVRNLVINDSSIPQARGNASRAASRMADPHFSLSSNWLKIQIGDRGVYTITGSNLIQEGVDIAAIIDPNSFRMFTLGGRQLDYDLSVGTGTYVPGNWMSECDILVEYGGDGTFDVNDRIIFYALTVDDYSDLYTPSADREAHESHFYTRENTYYLTWDSSFQGVPRRMQSGDAAPAGPTTVITFEERIFEERDRDRHFTFGDDGWFWDVVSQRAGSQTITLTQGLDIVDLDTSQPQTFRTRALAEWAPSGINNGHHAEYVVNAAQVAEARWNTSLNVNDDYDGGFDVTASSLGMLREGSNTVQLRVPRDENPEDAMIFAWFEVRFQRFLRLAQDGLLFSSPSTQGLHTYRATGLPGAGNAYVLDVTDQFRPLVLANTEVTPDGSGRAVRFSATRGVNTQYFWAGATANLRTPANMFRFIPKDLRATTDAPDMLIVTSPAFVTAAERLRQYRLGNLPMTPNPRIDIVTMSEVYDNFSGGVTDPVALRNYCKFLYDNFQTNGAPRFKYLLLFGDANEDYKGITSTVPNYVITNLNLTPSSLEAYTTDDWFSVLDAEDYENPGARVVDLATGRLPVASPDEANSVVDKIIAYETEAEFGRWRNRAILVADDENSFRSRFESDFALQSDIIAHNRLAPYIEPFKIYLTEFPAISSIKPASRLFFLEAWDEGALIINYIGHGSERQMADEQVFLSDDVPSLRNGLRLPLVMAYSCTLGRFAAGSSKSMSERLILKTDGGAIATVAATELTFITTNRGLNYGVFEKATPTTPGERIPLGVALLNAKVQALEASFIGGSGNVTVQENNEKYALIGDPALLLLSATESIEFDAVDVASVTAGKRQTFRGSVLKDGQLDTGFTGQVRLVVRESDDTSGYTRASDGWGFSYRYPGGTIYEGTADVTAGRFEFSVKIPRSAATGAFGYVLAYADNSSGGAGARKSNGTIDAVAQKDDVPVVPAAPGDSTSLQPIDGAPFVQLGFKSGATKVKPGDVLQAIVRDPDGINVLSTTPEGKVALVFDRSNLPLDVTKFFDFLHGGSDTEGRLNFPLPDLNVGDHEVVLKVSDSFGQTTLDTLSFSVTDPLDHSAEVVLNYPNPFEETTYFLVNLTGRAAIKLDIFTLSGRKIRTLQESGDPGQAWILWDGRDASGDAVANGTYLYVARVDFSDVDRPQQVLRGKVVKIQ